MSYYYEESSSRIRSGFRRDATEATMIQLPMPNDVHGRISTHSHSPHPVHPREHRPNNAFRAALQYQGHTSCGYTGIVDRHMLEVVRAETAVIPPACCLMLRVPGPGGWKMVHVVPQWGKGGVVLVGDVLDALQSAMPEYLRGGGRDEAQRLRRLEILLDDRELWCGI